MKTGMFKVGDIIRHKLLPDGFGKNREVTVVNDMVQLMLLDNMSVVHFNDCDMYYLVKSVEPLINDQYEDWDV